MTQGKLAWEIHDIMNALKPYEKLKNDIEGQEDSVLKLINQYVKEVIGEDEYGYGNKPDKQSAEQEIRSELRTEQRKRAGL